MEFESVKIIKTNRKTIALQITDEARLIVRSPYNISEKKIKEIIDRHKNWIKKKIEHILLRKSKTSHKEFVNGEGFLYLGRLYKLYIVENQEIPLKFDRAFYLAKSSLPEAREVLINWYRKESYQKIPDRVNFYAKKAGLEYMQVKITNAEKRWGSCSSRNLNFSWRLIMAPLPVIDYVVVHELVHLEEKNHSKVFWNKVKVLMPDYKKYDEWLKKNGYLLKI